MQSALVLWPYKKGLVGMTATRYLLLLFGRGEIARYTRYDFFGTVVPAAMMVAGVTATFALSNAVPMVVGALGGLVVFATVLLTHPDLFGCKRSGEVAPVYKESWVLTPLARN